MFKFNENEITLLETTLNQDDVITKIRRISQIVRDWWLKNSRERREEIALQSRWDGSSYGGDTEGIRWIFAGGFSESVFTNLVYTLCSFADDRHSYFLNALILRRAMLLHEHVKEFVNIIIRAADIVCKYEKEDEIQLVIRHILLH